MRLFNYASLANKKWDSEILSLVAGIYKEVGKQELYLKQNLNDLNHLVESAKIQSTEYSNKIEGIVSTSARIKKICEEKTTPKNRAEEEIAGYKDVLNIIYDNYDSIKINSNYLLQLHKVLYNHYPNSSAGKTKMVQNYIVANRNGQSEIIFTPLSPMETSLALEQICEQYNIAIGNNLVDPLILIPVFIHDFLCIHPFNDGNGRMSRLLTTLLLCQNGLFIGKYTSLELIIANSKDEYYSSLYSSQLGWHEEKEDPTPFIKYLLGVILAAYKNFEDRYTLIGNKLSAYEMVETAVKQRIGKFTKKDIIDFCPSLSISSIEGGLRAMVNKGLIKRIDNGRATYYIRLK